MLLTRLKQLTGMPLILIVAARRHAAWHGRHGMRCDCPLWTMRGMHTCCRLQGWEPQGLWGRKLSPCSADSRDSSSTEVSVEATPRCTAPRAGHSPGSCLGWTTTTRIRTSRARTARPAPPAPPAPPMLSRPSVCGSRAASSSPGPAGARCRERTAAGASRRVGRVHVGGARQSASVQRGAADAKRAVSAMAPRSVRRVRLGARRANSLRWATHATPLAAGRYPLCSPRSSAVTARRRLGRRPARTGGWRSARRRPRGGTGRPAAHCALRCCGAAAPLWRHSCSVCVGCASPWPACPKPDEPRPARASRPVFPPIAWLQGPPPRAACALAAHGVVDHFLEVRVHPYTRDMHPPPPPTLALGDCRPPDPHAGVTWP